MSNRRPIHPIFRTLAATLVATAACSTVHAPAPVHASAAAAGVTVTAPRGHRKVVVDRRRRVLLDGRLQISLEDGRAVTRPLWRRDGKALVFVQRKGAQLLAVAFFVEGRRTVVQQLPASRLRLSGSKAWKLFWISQQRVGIGPHEAAPRVVFITRS